MIATRNNVKDMAKRSRRKQNVSLGRGASEGLAKLAHATSVGGQPKHLREDGVCGNLPALGRARDALARVVQWHLCDTAERRISAIILNAVLIDHFGTD